MANTMTQNGGEGRLPQMAPLANPYVPYQMENPPKYEPEKGIIRGTLFPGLDLPFMGMVNNKPLAENCMSRLQMLAFGIQELALYLDTHRDDQEALALYRRYQEMYNTYKNEYLKQNGPLTHTMVSQSPEYDWLNEPWPWEYGKNGEV